MRKWLYVTLILLVALPAATALRSESVTLLTVSTSNETPEVGGTATMNLQITPGTGNVFIDSFPLTQLDTQISTRFAKEVACEYTEKDCEDVNFYYTIRASSSVVGGPSAGAAGAVLTTALLNNESLNDKTVITGTVNSGGYIGPVGGIDAKVNTAKAEGFNQVIVPKYSRSGDTVITNNSAYNEPGIQVSTVTTLHEAYEAFTGVRQPRSRNISVPEQYDRLMQGIAQDLCGRNDELLTNETSLRAGSALYNASVQTKQNAQEAMRKGKYYSAASYCFSANIDLREAALNDTSQEQRSLIRQGVVQDAEAYLDEIQSRPVTTMSDVEASIIVKERLYEVLDEDVQDERSVGYLIERFDSAKAWSRFYNYTSQNVSLNQDYLRQACLSKLREAEERVSYLDVLAPSLTRYQKELEDTRDVYQREDYTYCLFKASQLKAEANSVITGRSINEESQSEYVTDKLAIAEEQIAEQTTFFPILGYSYYTYAKSLQEEQPGAAAVFTEYAAEFSALDMYLDSAGENPVGFATSAEPLTCPVNPERDGDKRRQYALLGIGVFVGVLLVGVMHVARNLFRQGSQ